jgi:hypothetical protein
LPSCATLPPSKTTSGFIGHTSRKETDVVLHGDKSPGAAIGDQPSQPSTEVRLLGKGANAERVPRVCAGSCTASTSLRSRWATSGAVTLPALTTKSRRVPSPPSRYSRPWVVGSNDRPDSQAHQPRPTTTLARRDRVRRSTSRRARMHAFVGSSDLWRLTAGSYRAVEIWRIRSDWRQNFYRLDCSDGGVMGPATCIAAARSPYAASPDISVPCPMFEGPPPLS